MTRETCSGCGQPIKPMRGVPGAWVHASRTVAAWIRQSYNLVVAGLPKKTQANYPLL